MHQLMLKIQRQDGSYIDIIGDGGMSKFWQCVGHVGYVIENNTLNIRSFAIVTMCLLVMMRLPYMMKPYAITNPWY